VRNHESGKWPPSGLQAGATTERLAWRINAVRPPTHIHSALIVSPCHGQQLPEVPPPPALFHTNALPCFKSRGLSVTDAVLRISAEPCLAILEIHSGRCWDRCRTLRVRASIRSCCVQTFHRTTLGRSGWHPPQRELGTPRQHPSVYRRVAAAGRFRQVNSCPGLVSQLNFQPM